MRVLIVDDSAVVRGAVGRLVDGAPDCTVVSTAANGRAAIAAVRQLHPDVVILDIEMPEMDGLTALPLIRGAHPEARVLILSTRGTSGADVTMRALALGAADFVCKSCGQPGTTPRPASSVEGYGRELLDKVVTLGRAAQRAGRPGGTATAGEPRAAATTAPLPRAPLVAPRGAPVPGEPAVIAIASSTGGPAALTTVLEALPESVQAPILITQHMPPEFTRRLADRLRTAARRPCAEAVDGEPVVAGRIYVAPGDRHMTVVREEGEVRIRLTQDPPVHHCRPAADPMLRSLVQVHGSRVLAVVLTGMGVDGRDGAVELARLGGCVIAQDEATSTVWGMPGAVVHAGAATHVVPIARVAFEMTRLAARKPRAGAEASPA